MHFFLPYLSCDVQIKQNKAKMNRYKERIKKEFEENIIFGSFGLHKVTTIMLPCVVSFKKVLFAKTGKILFPFVCMCGTKAF